MGLSVMGVSATPYSMSYSMNGSVSGAAGSAASAEGVKRMLPVGAAGTVDGAKGVEDSRADRKSVV